MPLRGQRSFWLLPRAAGVGNEHEYELMGERIPDIGVVNDDGLPHHLTDAVPDRCVDEVLVFLRRQFGLS